MSCFAPAVLTFLLALPTAMALAAPAVPEHVMTPVYTGLVYPEGPIFDGRTLLFVDMKLGAILSYDGANVARVWSDPNCGPTALAPVPRVPGQWLVACHLVHELRFLDLANLAAPKQVARTPFRRPNDLYAGRDGVYVSSSGEFDPAAPIAGEIWLVRSPIDQHRVEGAIHYANGVAVTRNGRDLLVDEHLEHRVWRYPINSDGSLGPRTLAFDLTTVFGPGMEPLEGPDGVEPARDGSYYVAVYDGGTVLHVSATGALMERFVTPGYPKLTNIALKPDESGLYAVASVADEHTGALFYTDLPHPH